MSHEIFIRRFLKILLVSWGVSFVVIGAMISFSLIYAIFSETPQRTIAIGLFGLCLAIVGEIILSLSVSIGK